MEALRTSLFQTGELACFELDRAGCYVRLNPAHAHVLAAHGSAPPAPGDPFLCPVTALLASALESALGGTASSAVLRLPPLPSVSVSFLPIDPTPGSAAAVLGSYPVPRSLRADALTRLAEGVLNELNNLGVGLGAALEAVKAAASPRPATPDDSTPVNAVELLEEVETRTSAARRLARAIRSLAMEPPRELVAVDHVLEALEPRLRQSAPSSGLVIEAGAKGARLRADPKELGDALIELVKNAAEAGARRVVVRTRSESAEQVAIEVEDDGEGIEPDRLPRVFDVYVGSRKSAQGVGLTRVRSIVESHGGIARISSTPRAGTSVRLELPAQGAKPEEPEPAPPRPTELDVFVVDDAPEVRRVLGRVLRHAGHRVSEAEDGIDALEKLDARGTLPDVVVLDLMMPRMDGVETYRALRARSGDLPILITSGFHPSSLGFLATDPRASFLPKPFLPAEVIAALTDLMK